MAEKEHPAAKAGRYVRAAGIVVGREIDRRTAAASAKQAQVQAAPAPPPPPPPVPTATVAGKAVFGAFALSLLALALVLVHLDQFVSGTARTIVRLVLAAVLATGAFLLTTNWQQANERVGQRLLTRMWGPRGAVNKRERFVARAVRDVLTLIGIGLLAAAVYELLVALIGT